MLSFLTPNPPVPTVPKAVHTASNKGMSPRSRKITSSTVSRIYIRYRIVAVFRIFGTSLPTLGPGLSARSRCMVKPLPPVEDMASRNTSTPMPPSQWLKLLQYRIPLGTPSTWGRMEAPVVVNPDTISKSASM